MPPPGGEVSLASIRGVAPPWPLVLSSPRLATNTPSNARPNVPDQRHTQERARLRHLRVARLHDLGIAPDEAIGCPRPRQRDDDEIAVSGLLVVPGMGAELASHTDHVIQAPAGTKDVADAHEIETGPAVPPAD